MGSSPRSNSFTSVACSRCSDSGVWREVRDREQAITSAAVRIPFHTAMKRRARRTFALLQKWRQNHPFFMCEQRPYPVWFRAIRYSANIPEVALFINSRCLVVSYYYMRNFCNLIGLEQWYFSLI